MEMASDSLKQRVVLNPADCDLGFVVQPNGLGGSRLRISESEEKSWERPWDKPLAECWFGCRADVGIIGGKYCFGCKLVSFPPVLVDDDDDDVEAVDVNVCRVGISRGDASLGSLGDGDDHALACEIAGEKFVPGDTIVCAVNLEDKPMASISFFKNGNFLFNTIFNAEGGSQVNTFPWESAFFPHVLLKNPEVELQFTVEDGLVLQDGFKSWASSLVDGNAIVGPCLDDPKNCEVLFLMGLPYSGKSTWAKDWMKKHPEKRYVLLSEDTPFALMKVPPESYKLCDPKLSGKAADITFALLDSFILTVTPRNYIFDLEFRNRERRQSHLLFFSLFKKIAVVVFPSPEEAKARLLKAFHEHGSLVSRRVIHEYLVSFVLPNPKIESFDEVNYVELSKDESHKLLVEMKLVEYGDREANSLYRFGDDSIFEPSSEDEEDDF